VGARRDPCCRVSPWTVGRQKDGKPESANAEPIESSFPTRFARIESSLAWLHCHEVGCAPYQSQVRQLFPGRKVYACPLVHRSIHHALGSLCLRAGGPESPKGRA